MSSSPKALIGDESVDCLGNPEEKHTFPFLALSHPFVLDNDDNKTDSDSNDHQESIPITPTTKLIACSPSQIHKALQNADVVSDANGPWSSLSLKTRHEILKEAAAEIDTEQMLYAHIDVRETGIPLPVQFQIVAGLAPVALMSMEKAITDVLDCKQKVPSKFGGNIIGKRRPISPALIIAPWNVPCGTIIPKLFVALLCGCKVIVKPSEYAPTSITRMCHTIHAIIYGKYKIPNVLQVVHGGGFVGAALVAAKEIQCVQFTGAPKTAGLVAAQCAPLLKPFLAECGGSNALIVCKDADLTAAVRYCAMSVITLNGQWCMSCSRVLVHKDLKEAFLRLLRNYLERRIRLMISPNDVEGVMMKNLTGGGVADADADAIQQQQQMMQSSFSDDQLTATATAKKLALLELGPLASETHANLIRQSITELVNSNVPKSSVFTLFDAEKVWKENNNNNHSSSSSSSTTSSTTTSLPRSYINVQCIISPNAELSSHRELFGPVFSLHEFDNEDEAVRMTNLSTGMLCCYVFSKDVERAQNIGVQLRTCMTMVNSANFCFEVEDPAMEIESEFWGSAGSGSDGTGAAAAKFFSRVTWAGVAGEQTHEGHELH